MKYDDYVFCISVSGIAPSLCPAARIAIARHSSAMTIIIRHMFRCFPVMSLLLILSAVHGLPVFVSLRAVQAIKAVHFFSGQFKIKYVEVFCNVFRIG